MRAKTYGQVDDYELIKLVESYPILYDKDHSRGNTTSKDEAWRELSLKLNVSERAVITRWKSIRDRFGKEYRRLKDTPDHPTNWEIFPHLLFLKDHYKHGNANNGEIVNFRFEPKKRKCKRAEMSDSADDGVDEMIFHQQLIGLVKRYPVLYDKQKIRDSKNLIAKHTAWEDIAGTLSTSDEVCYKSWKKLRDRFAREIRRHKLKPKAPVTWTYFKDMMFLEPHYRKGKPLPVDREKEPDDTTQNYNWDEDYPYECIEEEEVVDEKSPTEPIENVTLFEVQSNELASEPTTYDNDTVIEDIDPPAPSSSKETIRSKKESEEKLKTLICSLQETLQQAQDCLKSIHAEATEEQQKTESKLTQNTKTILTLLDGLGRENSRKAEQKILNFLSEY